MQGEPTQDDLLQAAFGFLNVMEEHWRRGTVTAQGNLAAALSNRNVELRAAIGAYYRSKGINPNVMWNACEAVVDYNDLIPDYINGKPTGRTLFKNGETIHSYWGDHKTFRELYEGHFPTPEAKEALRKMEEGADWPI